MSDASRANARHDQLNENLTQKLVPAEMYHAVQGDPSSSKHEGYRVCFRRRVISSESSRRADKRGTGAAPYGRIYACAIEIVDHTISPASDARTRKSDLQALSPKVCSDLPFHK